VRPVLTLNKVGSAERQFQANQKAFPNVIKLPNKAITAQM